MPKHINKINPVLPPFLQPGDSVGIAAPASSFSKPAFLDGIELIKRLGYQPIYRDDVFENWHGFAGDDQRRQRELDDLLASPAVKAILFARGGWGIGRITPQLNLRALQSTPKWIVGYSDLTTLHQAAYAELAFPFLYGPVVANALDPKSPGFDLALDSLGSVLNGSLFNRDIKIPEAVALQHGHATAPILGGCLTLLASACGTTYSIPFADSILLIEDIGEKPYRIDRMLTQLRHAGRLDHIRGVICGAFANCGDDEELKRVILSHIPDPSIPVLWNTPYGHLKNLHTLPLGITCHIQTTPAICLRFSLSCA